MGVFDRLLGKSKVSPPHSTSKFTNGISHQLPSSMVEKEFGEVDVRYSGSEVELLFTILMEPQGAEAEGWQTGVALDASSSMTDWYGRGLIGDVPDHIEKQYIKRGWIQKGQRDGRNVSFWSEQAYQDAIQQGYMKLTDNIVGPLAQEFTAYLADNLDENGGTTVIYWACGDGKAYEVIGDLTSQQCKTQKFEGPKNVPFGAATHLTPVVKYFVDRFKNAKRGMYIFITDGKLDDLDEIRGYTKDLAQQIESGKRNFVKCVLIGVGDQIDEKQLEELDDLETGTNVDIWDHKIAKEMRSLIEIFAEVVNENQIVAPIATIYDATGQVVKRFTDGLPAKVTFTMSASSEYFELEVGSQRIRQRIKTL